MTLSTEKLLSAIDSRRTVPFAWGTVWLLSLVALVMREPDRSVVGTLPADTPLWQSRVIIYLLHSAATLLSCILLIHLNNTCNLMQRRTWLPATTLLFLNLCNPAFADRPNTALLLSPLLVVWLYLLFTSYQKEGREAAYGIGLLTTACTLLWPPAAAMIVALGTGPAYMQNLTWKSATAFLLGIATPVWLLFVANIIFDLHIYYTFDQFVSYIPGLPYSLQVDDPTALVGYGMAALIGVSCRCRPPQIHGSCCCCSSLYWPRPCSTPTARPISCRGYISSRRKPRPIISFTPATATHPGKPAWLSPLTSCFIYGISDHTE